MANGNEETDSPQVMAGRIVRFRDAIAFGSPLTFIDSGLTGHRRLNIALVGDTAAEDPGLKPLITGPHTFQLGMFMCLPSEGPAWHLHDYVEAFIPLSGRWRFRVATSEDRLNDPDGEYELGPWDVISLPAGTWRSFENTDSEPAWCLGVLDAHEQFTSKDPQWPAEVVAAAAELGLAADERGKLQTSPDVTRLAGALRVLLSKAAARTGPPAPWTASNDEQEG